MKDIIIIGSGTAGMTAAIYAARSGKDVLVLEKKAYGGQILNSSEVANYPGYEKIDGFTFSTKLYDQVKSLNVEVKFEEVENIEGGKIKKVITNKNTYECKSIIIATGLEKRKLNIENEERLTGKGISYCATCDGAFFMGSCVAVVGGGNTALEDANYLSDYCRKVYLINRSEIFKADETLLKRFREKSNTEIILNANVSKLIGDESLEKIELDNGMSIDVKGLFIAVGQIPNCNFNNIELIHGFIKSNEQCTTNLEGIFVAGDIRDKDVRQLVTAASDGAVAAINAVKYIQSIK